MAKFAVKTVETIRGDLVIKQLIRLQSDEKPLVVQAEIDRVELSGADVERSGVLDDYEQELQAVYGSSFKKILTSMELVANGRRLPVEKFRDITPSRETIREYEFKAGDLRVYCIKIAGGQLVILCGYKNQQPSDIVRFRSLKQQYLESLNPK